MPLNERRKAQKLKSLRRVQRSRNVQRDKDEPLEHKYLARNVVKKQDDVRHIEPMMARQETDYLSLEL